jgi:hypothetical protein
MNMTISILLPELGIESSLLSDLEIASILGQNRPEAQKIYEKSLD